jgi:hypothetical protein
MIDREVAEAGIAALIVAAGELMEEAHQAAVIRMPAEPGLRIRLVSELGQTGRDIAALAAAAEVLIRRSS